MENLELVLRQLKNNKSRDPLRWANELFKPNNAGKDLKLAILRMMNEIKRQQTVPDIIKRCNITSIYKKKGSRKDFSNYRGIFRVTILRSILDKFIYNDEYANIDENLTDSNVGARRDRNIRDNIFVINAITNNVRKRNLKDTDIQIYDAEKYFDKLWANECYNDAYENGFKSDKLALLYNINKNAQVGIKTATGITKREDIYNIIMQGSVFGSLICTSIMDKLAKMFYKDKNLLYMYKGEVEVPILGMVDGVLSVAKCSNTVVTTTATINSFMEVNKLKLAPSKCAKHHIGKKQSECPVTRVHEQEMQSSKAEKYLCDVI